MKETREGEVSRDDLNRILDEFNYSFEIIIQELEVLRDLVASRAIKMKKLCSAEFRCDESELTDFQITEAASYAAMEQLRREIRDPYEPPDFSGRWDDEDSMIEVRRLDEREGA